MIEEEVEAVEECVVASLFPRPDFYLSGPDQEEIIAEIVEADDACQKRKDGSSVQIYEEDELESQSVIELTGSSAQIIFRCPPLKPNLNLLFLYIKCDDNFFFVDVQVVDNQQNFFTLSFSNKRSIVKIDSKKAQMPIIIQNGFKWQLLKFDLQHILSRAFAGAQFHAAIQITIRSSCRIFRLYLADKEYADIQLPPHLQTLRPPQQPSY